MEHDDDRIQPQEHDEIEGDTVSAIVEPILDELERTAQNLSDPRPITESPRRTGVPPARGPLDAAAGAVDFGLRVVERAALIPRRMVKGLLGTAFEGSLPPGPSQPPQPAQARPGTASSVAAIGAVKRAPARTVRSPLTGRPGMVTGSDRAGVRGLPGRRTRLRVTVHNRSSVPVSARFRSSDLISRTGGSIPAASVTFDPPSLSLSPRSSANVAVTVHVPFGQTPGKYVGLVEAGEKVRTVVELVVG